MDIAKARTGHKRKTRPCQWQGRVLVSQRHCKFRRQRSRKHIGNLFNVRITDEFRSILDLVQLLLRIIDIDKIHAVRIYAPIVPSRPSLSSTQSYSLHFMIFACRASMFAATEGGLIVRPAAVEQPVGRLIIGRHLVVRQLAVLVLAAPLEQFKIA